MKSSRRVADLTRRGFLRRSAIGGGWFGFITSLGTRRTRAAAPKQDNPFAYDVERLRKVDPALIRYDRISRFKCPRPDPRSVALGPDNRLYIAAGRYVSVVDPSGSPVSEIPLPAATRFAAVSNEGEVFVGIKDHIEIYDAQGKRKATWDRPPGRPLLTGAAVGSNDVFVGDAGNRVLLRYDRSGKFLRRIGEKDPGRNIPGFVLPSACLDVQIGLDGLIWVNNAGRHKIEAYTFDGDLEVSWGKPSAAIDGFCGCCNPVNLAIMPDGRCVTFEKGLPRVKVHGAKGELDGVVAAPNAFAEVAGVSAGPNALDAALGGLDGVIDLAGRIHVLDLIGADVQTFQRKAGAAKAPIVDSPA